MSSPYQPSPSPVAPDVERYARELDDALKKAASLGLQVDLPVSLAALTYLAQVKPGGNR